MFDKLASISGKRQAMYSHISEWERQNKEKKIKHLCYPVRCTDTGHIGCEKKKRKLPERQDESPLKTHSHLFFGAL